MRGDLQVVWQVFLLFCVVTFLAPCSGQRLDKLREFHDNAGRLGLQLENLSPGSANKVDGERWRQSSEQFYDLLFDNFKNELIQNVFNSELVEAISPECVDGFIKLLLNKTDQLHLPQLVDLIDAFGKLEPGLLMGNTYSYGSYDECMGIDTAQYCLVPLVPLKQKKQSLSSFLTYEVGMCLPQGCSETDIEIVINMTRFLSLNGAIMCEIDKGPPYNAGAIVMLIVCGIFAVLIALGTSIDFIITTYHNNNCGTLPLIINSDTVSKDSTTTERSPLLHGATVEQKNKVNFLDFITAFSLYKTVPTILATKQPPSAITSINGIRVMSMFWVIVCHTHLFVALIQKVDNPVYVLNDVGPRFSYQAIINGFFSVDSFFFLSGLLAAYLTLREMTRRKGGFPILMYYLHRYLRLTPTLAFVMFFAWFLTLHLADGPIYQQGVGVDSAWYQGCENYWWTNLLYINNVYPVNVTDGCIYWVWYLANDMQFFVVAPLMIVPLFYSLPVGLLCVGLFLAGSFAASGFSAGYYNIQANQFAYFIYGVAPDPNADALYFRPYHRIPPYLVGIVLGYLLFKKAQLPFGKLVNWFGYILLWVLATGLCMSTVYGLYPTWHQHLPTLAENVIYQMFSRFAWGVGLAFAVFACHNGYGGVINTFLSMKFWIPLSRLTFTAYLVHPIVLTVIFGTARQPFHYADIPLAVYAVGDVVLSYGAAAIVAACVEFPLANIEVAFFKVIGLGVRESTRQGTVAPAVKQCSVPHTREASSPLRHDS